MTARLVTTLVALWVLAGCTVGPDYRRPVVTTPAAFRGAATGADPTSVADLKWFDVFKDERLQEIALIQYDRAIQMAFREVSDLVEYQKVREKPLWPKDPSGRPV